MLYESFGTGKVAINTLWLIGYDDDKGDLSKQNPCSERQSN